MSWFDRSEEDNEAPAPGSGSFLDILHRRIHDEDWGEEDDPLDSENYSWYRKNR